MGCRQSTDGGKADFTAVGPGEVKWYTIKKKNKVAINKRKQPQLAPAKPNHERFVLDSASDMRSFPRSGERLQPWAAFVGRQ